MHLQDPQKWYRECELLLGQRKGHSPWQQLRGVVRTLSSHIILLVKVRAVQMFLNWNFALWAAGLELQVETKRDSWCGTCTARGLSRRLPVSLCPDLSSSCRCRFKPWTPWVLLNPPSSATTSVTSVRLWALVVKVRLCTDESTARLVTSNRFQSLIPQPPLHHNPVNLAITFRS